MKNENAETKPPVPAEPRQRELLKCDTLDFDSDEPLTCDRDQSGDTTCESCQ